MAVPAEGPAGAVAAAARVQRRFGRNSRCAARTTPPPPIIQRLLIISVLLIGIIISFFYFSQCDDSIKTAQKEIVPQKHTLEGVVLSNDEGVEGVEVQIIDMGLSTFTNSKGLFKLDVPPDNLHETYLIR